MANNNQTATGNVYLDTTSAQFALQQLNNKVKEYDKELAQANTTAGRRITLEAEKAKLVKRSLEVELQLQKGLGVTINQQSAFVKHLTKELSNLPKNTQAYTDALKKLNNEKGVLRDMQTGVEGIDNAQKKMVASSGALTKAGVGVASFFGNIAANVAGNLSSRLGDFFSDAVEEAKQAEASTSRLRNTLDNLGRADAFDRLSASANAMAEKFTFLDNDDLLEVFTQLITYGKLTENQMNALLPVIVDFAAKSGTSVNDSASIIIKALEGNSRALKDYGINVKDGENVTERLAILMTELAPKVKDAAETFGNDLAGETAKATQQIANIKEEIGNKLTPVIKTFYATVRDVMGGWKSIFDNINGVILRVYNVATNTFGVFKDLATFNLQGALKRVGGLNASQVMQKSNADLAAEREAINREASGAQRDAQGRDKAGQQALLRQENELLRGSLAYLKEIRKTRKETDADVRAAAREVEKDLARVTAISNVINGAAGGNTILGLGDNDAGGKKEKATKEKIQKAAKSTLDEYNAFAKKLNQEINDLLTPDASKKMIAILRETQAELDKLKKLATNDEQFQATKLKLLEKQGIAIKSLIESETKLYKAPINNGTGIVPPGFTGQRLPEVQKTVVEIMPVIPDEDVDAAGLGLQKVIDKIKAGMDTATEDALDRITFILDLAGAVTNILSSFNQAKEARENAELKKELGDIEVRKRAVENLQKSKIISAEEAAKRISAIDAEIEKKREDLARKQFERNKKLQIAQAIINGAMAVTKILAETPKFDFGIATAIQIGIAAATTAAQIATIAATKYAKGGRMTGPSHSDGGMPVINPRTGRKEAEVEGGEYILSKRTVANNRALADALLDASMNRNGSSINMPWDARPYRHINYRQVSASMQKVKFSNGGVWGGSNVASDLQMPSDRALLTTLQQLQNQNFKTQQINSALINTINNLQSRGLDVSLHKLKEAQQQQDRINDEAVFG